MTYLIFNVMNTKEQILKLICIEYTGKFEMRLNDKRPKLLFGNTLGWDFLNKINDVVQIIQISSTEKNSVFHRNFGYGQIVYINYKND